LQGVVLVTVDVIVVTRNIASEGVRIEADVLGGGAR
jgi:hypothetical protein